MKAAFFHDTPLLFWKDKKIYSIGFDYDVWTRYLKVFDQLVVATRKINPSNLNHSLFKGMKLSSGPNVDFNPIDEYNSSLDVLYNYKKIRKQIRSVLKSVDCAIVRLPSTIGIIAFYEAMNLKLPVAVELVGCPWDALWNFGNTKGKLAAPIFFIFTKRIVKKSSHTLYVTKYFLQKRYPTQGYSIDCSNINIPENSEDILDMRIDKIKKIKDKIIKIGMIGALGSKYKGFDLAIDALSYICRKYERIELHILGPGNSDKWEKYAKKRGVTSKVFFDGVLKNGDEVFKWLDQIDIYIQPSKAEGLPRSLIEAMSRGCPTIGAHTGGIPELLDADFLHKKGDSKDLSKRIINLLENPDIMINQARTNFYKSREYSKENLEKRRTSFWTIFRDYAKSNQENNNIT